MRKIATRSADELRALFTNTASKMGLNEAIVEKDFWVCWVLDYLFNRSPWKSELSFKGGTSLSKAFHAIERFSEDIDLILDWRVLGYAADEPWEARSNNQQDRFNQKANQKTAKFLRDEFIPALQRDLTTELGIELRLILDEADEQTVLFFYPHGFADHAILRQIRLEIGTLAAWSPAKVEEITPYAAEHYGHLFSQPSTEVLTVAAERTFWEKITILHREAHRPESYNFPQRYSRHYYDVYCLALSDIKKSALSDPALLERVVSFKQKFYRSPWAKYEDAKVGKIKIMPPSHNISALRGDYRHMLNMIFGSKPSFDEILSELQELEREINLL